jgi:hypothetical protein
VQSCSGAEIRVISPRPGVLHLNSDGYNEEEHREAEFLSPLEEALLHWNDVDPDQVMPLSPNVTDLGVSFAADDSLEVPAWAAFNLQGQGGTSNQSIDALTTERDVTRKNSSIKLRNKRSSERKPEFSTPVLEAIEVEDNEFDMDIQGGGNTPWTKLLLLEELGTASSWAILIIPYVAFVLSIVLDTHSSVFLTKVGPLLAEHPCSLESAISGGSDSLWLQLAEGNSCSHPFVMQQQSGLSNFQFQSYRYRKAMHEGWAFVSGPIHDVPPMSVFLQGDSHFDLLSTEAIAMVSQGMILQSTIVTQRDSATRDWATVSISAPSPLAMHCIADENKATWDSQWNCVSPRIVDVLFSLPGTGILSGEDLQVVVLYALAKTSFTPRRDDDDSVDAEDVSYVYSDTPGAASLLFNTVVNNTLDGLEEVVKSSSYIVEHASALDAQVNIAVRLSTLLITSAFLLFWCRALLGKEASFDLCCKIQSPCLDTKAGTDEEKAPINKKPFSSRNKFWWESPWIVFPERRYLLVLLLCLILIQNPLLAYAYFYPALYESRRMHAAVDCMVGIGIFGTIMILHCLFHGLRYHTAQVNRRRAKQQRHVLELRRAAKYMVKPVGTEEETEDEVSRYLHEYYETYGDADGSDFSALDTRLRHDPCGDDWPDFLLPKLLLFTCAVASVVTASVYRFPVANTTPFSQQDLQRFNTIYVTSSCFQLVIAFVWVIMIARQATRSGWMLRKEPFLSTRPAQLAYRIFLSILLLGFVAFVIPCLVDAYSLLRKWTSDDSIETHQTEGVGDLGRSATSTVDVMLQVLIKVSECFPYSGTAGSIGSGKILYATVCGLIMASIFLPSAEVSKRRNRYHENTSTFSTLALSTKRDKRLVVTLARYTQSWRIFPLPILKVSLSSVLLSEVPFKIGPRERSTAYFGRYTPVFCLEVACWLLESSWQAYYSPKDFPSDSGAVPFMALETIGLKLERCILDKSTDSQVFVATNLHSQIDGEEDSIVVVSFRGTANTTNMAIDLKWGQVPLLNQIIGIDDFPMFQVSGNGVHMNDSGDWFWDSPYIRKADLASFRPPNSTEGCLWLGRGAAHKRSVASTFSFGAKAIVAATPVARQTLPCVHEGFLEAYSHMRKQVLTCVVEVMQRQLAKAIERSQVDGASLVLPKVYITGHSLGGSVGQLFALDLASNCVLEVPTDHTHAERLDTMDGKKFRSLSSDCSPRNESGGANEVFFSPFDDSKWFHNDNPSYPTTEKTLRLQPPIAVYTYGQPRVGNHAFSRLYKQRVPHTFRVVNEGDALTTLPNTVMLGGQYKHAGLEVILDEGCTGNIIVGPTVVETMFRFSKVRTSVAAHFLDGYRQNLESGFSEDELHEYYRGHGITKSSPAQLSSKELPEWLTQVKRPAGDYT